MPTTLPTTTEIPMNTTTLPYFWRMYQLERFHTDRGYYFFSSDNKRFFNSRIQTTPPYKGRVFVTSERMNDRYPRRYSVRYIDNEGHIMTVNGFQAFESRYDAHAFAKSYAEENFALRGCISVRITKESTNQ